MVEPVTGKNGKKQNPLAVAAQSIHLPWPGEEIADEFEAPGEWEEYDEDEDKDGEWEYEEDLPDVDSVPFGEPRSEDEQFAGVNRPPPRTEQDGQPRKKRRRRPPMPKVPNPELAEGEVFDPPFTVLKDGTVVGPRVGEGLDVMPKGFDPPRGSAEAAVQLIYAKPPQKSGGTG
jgi:hypothetical protein